MGRVFKALAAAVLAAVLAAALVGVFALQGWGRATLAPAGDVAAFAAAAKARLAAETKGNAAFGTGNDYAAALAQYKSGLGYLSDTFGADAAQSDSISWLNACFSNSTSRSTCTRNCVSPH